MVVTKRILRKGGTAYRLLISLRWKSQYEVTSKPTSEVKAEGIAKFLPKERVSIFGNRNVPTSLGFPNKKGVVGYDPEMPLSEMIAEMPGAIAEHSKLFVKEYVEAFSIEDKELLENIGHLHHNEARADITFDTPERLKLWRTGADSDWNAGYSKCEFVPTDRKTAVFRGNIDTRIVKDGKLERAGWAAIKLEDRRAFLRKKYFDRWQSFTHLLIKCRGDGRSYKVMLYAPGALDVTWGDSFSYPLHTHGGPYWQYEKIPFSRFIHTVYGRIQDKQYPPHLGDVSSLGIVLMDRIDGKFCLELDFIGVVNDTTHLEKHAYESYVIRLFNPSGF
ncbi:hypothetical protein AB6A40_003649 [Gnathostoma spinigerum]|uniref:NADH:ubiquinone oxidoreductase intermediate-associated protein 30 domain-containing protein n=1 Tax=Gnathostoma spinigerum TaxID=75299 RepID=A0ABD6EA71_9BILA